MALHSLEKLREAVTAASQAQIFSVATREWTVIRLEEDPTESGECVCGHPNLVKLFTIRNDRNGNELFPIGSKCVEHFGEDVLNLQVRVLSRLLALRQALNTGSPVGLDSTYFSRDVLLWLWERGAFPETQWNRYNGENDYEFLVKMFNKRNKEEISDPQHRKIRTLLMRYIKPFLRDHEALK